MVYQLYANVCKIRRSSSAKVMPDNQDVSEISLNLRFPQEPDRTLARLLQWSFLLAVLQTFARQDAHYPGRCWPLSGG